jgi:DHA1 family bicyclomycin/chloramphenicol resistance-like MFS transporter
MSSAFSPPPMTAKLLGMLAALMTLTPLSVDMTVPSIPSIAMAYGVLIQDAELTISYYLLGFSIGQFLGGPLSDRFGRRFIVLTGLGAFIVGSLIALLASSISGLWVARVVQALGAGLAVVNVGSAVRDLSGGREGAQHMARVVQVMLIAPLLAPFLGMALYKTIGWEANFWFFLLYGVVIFALFVLWFPETSPHRSPWWPVKNYLYVVRDRRGWGYMVTIAASYGTLLGFTVSSPSVLMGYFEVPATQFPFVFAGIVVFMMLVARLGMRALGRMSVSHLIWLAQLSQFAAISALVLYLSFWQEHQLWVFLPMIGWVLSSHALLVGNCTSATTEFFPTRSGTAMALIGAIGFGAGGLTGTLISVQADPTPWTMALTIWCCCCAAILVRWLSREKPVGEST